MLTAFVISFCYIARLLFGAFLEQVMTCWFFKPPSAANYNSEAFKLIKEYYVVFTDYYYQKRITPHLFLSLQTVS